MNTVGVLYMYIHALWILLQLLLYIHFLLLFYTSELYASYVVAGSPPCIYKDLAYRLCPSQW